MNGDSMVEGGGNYLVNQGKVLYSGHRGIQLMQHRRRPIGEYVLSLVLVLLEVHLLSRFLCVLRSRTMH